MVEVDGGDDGDLGIEDVRRVPRAAEADLDDRDVDRCVGEGGVGERDQHLEEVHPASAGLEGPGVDELDQRCDLVVGGDELLTRDRLARQRDPLTDVVQVRRGEAPRGEPALAQDRVDHPARRRLAVGAGEMDRGVGALRVAGELHDRADAVERRADVVLGGAGQDLLLDLAHPLHLLEVAGRLEGCGIRAAAHDGSPASSSRTIHTLSGSPEPGVSRWVSTNPCLS